MNDAKRGVVAAGHPVTAEAGAEILREGGNAVDAAVAAILTSFVAESPLTGFGAGGFMLVHKPGEPDVVVDFFVAAGGADGTERTAELVPIPVYFDETPQTFNCGAASCGVPGNAAGIERVLERFGSVPLERLAAEGIRIGREGIQLSPEQAYFHEILNPILTSTPEAAALYAPGGDRLVEGDLFRYPEMSEALERFAAEGADPFYGGDIAERVCAWVRERGGTLGMDDMRAYEPIEREPVQARFRDRDVLTNPPPSSGGILIAYSLGLLERLGERSGVEEIVAVTQAANSHREEGFHEGLHTDGFTEQFLDPGLLAEVAKRIESERLGSTTHLAVLDGDGMCATVTCSNGTGSGLYVPGTGVHVNNMLGEEDLNPHGFHQIPPGRRVSSMMAPTVVLRDGQIVLGLGSAGSNRIRSAILQTAVRAIEEGMDAGEAVRAPRVHFEGGTVQAEPGVDEEGLERLEARDIPVVRWKRQNLYFGGVQAVARDPSTGELTGGGDPRRGGAVVLP